MLSFAICQAEERIISGVQPAGRLSQRATERLAAIRDNHEFIDGCSLALVSDGTGQITAWHFAGGIVSASIARELKVQGVPPTGWDDVSITVRSGDFSAVARALSEIDPITAHPTLPDDLSTALKFGLCLPPDVIAAVQIARTSKPQEMAETLQKPKRFGSSLLSET